MISSTVLNIPYANILIFKDCSFTRINSKHGPGLIMKIADYYGLVVSQIFVTQCRFSNINSSVIIRTHVQKATPDVTLQVTIYNTSFSMLKDAIVLYYR